MRAVRFLVFVFALLGIATPALAEQNDPLQKVGHILIVFEENHSFDNLFGLFPGANGIFNAGEAAIQVDENGKAFPTLPPVLDTRQRAPDGKSVVESRFPPTQANAPFLIDPYVSLDGYTGDLVHRYYQEKKQINGGKMNRFAGVSTAGGLAMGYFDISDSYLWRLASQYTLADNMFHSAFGGSFLNHMFLICSCALQWGDASADDRKSLLQSEVMREDGYLINTIYSQQFHAVDAKPPFLPPMTAPMHIGDRLDAKKPEPIKWKWYAGGFNDALAGHPDPLFQFHHQPFMYFARFKLGSDAQKEHLQDYDDLVADIKGGRLPPVAFYKPIGRNNLHPDYANLSEGDHHLEELINLLMSGPQWNDTLVLITADEHGGYWDHVAPPKRDDFGPGTRIPLIAVGPMVKRGFVDHTQYDFGSILKTIEERFGLDPVVGSVDGKATAMRNLLQENP